MKTNQGISGKNVTINAGAVAVGTKARASNRSSESAGPGPLDEALRQLAIAVGKLTLKPSAHEDLNKDIKALGVAVHEPEPDKERIGGLLASMAAKLKVFGVVVTETVGLVEPIKQIAELVRVSLGF